MMNRKMNPTARRREVWHADSLTSAETRIDSDSIAIDADESRLKHTATKADLEASAALAAQHLKLLANEQRLIVLCRLSEGEMSVGDLADYVGLNQSALSQHLAKLRAEGIVTTRRAGQTIFYRLANPSITRIIDLLCELYRGD